MRRIFTTLVALCLVVLNVAVSAADSSPRIPEQGKEYAWYADFVSLDEATGTLTAKARLRYEALPAYEQFKPGDRFALQWYTSAWGETDRIQDLARKEEIDQVGLYVMPAEFVSLDRTSRELTFRTAVKGDALRMLKSLKPQSSIRVISRYWPAPNGDTIVAVERHNAMNPSRTD